jgi:hypothetical protein
MSVDIKKLEEELIKLNIKYLSLCQENIKNNNMIHIQFESEHYEKFMTIITNFDDDKTLYYKVESEDGIHTLFNLKNKNLDGHPDIKIVCSLFFVPDFYKMIMDKLVQMQ